MPVGCGECAQSRRVFDAFELMGNPEVVCEFEMLFSPTGLRSPMPADEAGVLFGAFADPVKGACGSRRKLKNVSIRHSRAYARLRGAQVAAALCFALGLWWNAPFSCRVPKS